MSTILVRLSRGWKPLLRSGLGRISMVRGRPPSMDYLHEKAGLVKLRNLYGTSLTSVEKCRI
jgi:hypothetical protein